MRNKKRMRETKRERKEWDWGREIREQREGSELVPAGACACVEGQVRAGGGRLPSSPRSQAAPLAPPPTPGPASAGRW